MEELTRLQASTIFKTRTNMLDVKKNFSSKHTNKKCRKCEEPLETQEHVLEHCIGIHRNNLTKVTNDEIFEEQDLKKLKHTSDKINRIMKNLNS